MLSLLFELIVVLLLVGSFIFLTKMKPKTPMTLLKVVGVLCVVYVVVAVIIGSFAQAAVFSTVFLLLFLLLVVVVLYVVRKSLKVWMLILAALILLIIVTQVPSCGAPKAPSSSPSASAPGASTSTSPSSTASPTGPTIPNAKELGQIKVRTRDFQAAEGNLKKLLLDCNKMGKDKTIDCRLKEAKHQYCVAKHQLEAVQPMYNADPVIKRTCSAALNKRSAQREAGPEPGSIDELG